MPPQSRRLFRCGLFAALALALSGSARAGIVFSENFDSGSATYTAGDPYWTDHSQANGFIVKNSAAAGIGFSEIATDASGSGYFLLTGTANTIPANREFYISSSFAVAQNTDYQLSFKLANENTVNNGSVQAEIGGQTFGPVSATGTYSSGGWQTFTFAWNSGANTSASVILRDLTGTAVGNDFGLDEISVVSAVPEPSSVLLGALGVIGAAGYGLRRRKVAA